MWQWIWWSDCFSDHRWCTKWGWKNDKCLISVSGGWTLNIALWRHGYARLLITVQGLYHPLILVELDHISWRKYFGVFHWFPPLTVPQDLQNLLKWLLISDPRSALCTAQHRLVTSDHSPASPFSWTCHIFIFSCVAKQPNNLKAPNCSN